MKTIYWGRGGAYKPYTKPCVLLAGHRGAHRNNNLKWHQAKAVKLATGEVIPEVDIGVAALVQQLNDFGLRTGASCQGTRSKKPDRLYYAYVSLYGNLVEAFVKKLRKSIWFSLTVETDYPDATVLRWDAKYTKVLTTCVSKIGTKEA